MLLELTRWLQQLEGLFGLFGYLTFRGILSALTALALSLWSLGRKEEAVQWYAAAVRSEPQLWNTTAQFARLLPDWRDAERAVLTEVQAAWAADPPSWP